MTFAPIVHPAEAGELVRLAVRAVSTFTYGTVVVDNIDVQPDDSFHMTNRRSLNLTWLPIPRFRF